MFLVIKGVQQVAAERRRNSNLSDFFTNAIFRDIVISTSATLGLYIIVSVIHVRVGPIYLLWLIEDARRLQMDPWHMVTSLVQYTLIAPSYINILNVYAVFFSSFFPHLSRTNPPPVDAPSSPMSSRSRTCFVVP